MWALLKDMTDKIRLLKTTSTKQPIIQHSKNIWFLNRTYTLFSNSSEIHPALGRLGDAVT